MKKSRIFLMIALGIAIVTSCDIIIDAISIDQPQPDGSMAPRIEAGQTATFTVTGHIETPADRDPDQKFVMAMLAPQCWDIRNTMTVTMHCEGADDAAGNHVAWDQEWTLSPLPDDDEPANMKGYTWSSALTERFGTPAGMEWVAFVTDDEFAMKTSYSPKYEISVTGPVAMQNLRTTLAFFTNTYYDGMNTDTQYWDMKRSDIFTVYNGEGSELVMGNTEHFNKVYPLHHVQGDLVTYRFLGDTYDNGLNGGTVYMSATAHTRNGKDIKKTARMYRPDPTTNEYVLSIWPRGFFGIDADDAIESVDYEYTNARGTVVINNAYEASLFGLEAPAEAAYTDIYSCE